MNNLEKFLKEHASKEPLIIDEALINNAIEMEYEKFEEELEALAEEGKITYTHETFPPGSSNEQIVVHWIK